MDSDSSSDEGDSGTNVNLKINESYAENYNRYREKEVYQRLKDKHGEAAANQKMDEIESSSESSEEEDSDGKEWTEETDKDFFKTLANLKRKDSKIYDGKTSFFSKAEESKSVAKEKKEKPMTLGDLERAVMTEKGGEFDDMADEKLAAKSRDKTYVQELADIKSSLQKATAEDSDSDDDLLQTRSKTTEEKAVEEQDYRKWLLGQKQSLADEATKSELGNLREFWTDKKLDRGEKFLRDYILNKRYLDDDDGDHGKESDLSEDEKTLEAQAEFEHKYNFRFEDPDQDFIKKYPRTIAESMRRKDDSRKKRREEVAERKTREKEKKREELKQLKALKRREILDKLEKLRKITGNDELAFKDEDLEEDFDPEKYDERMNAVFDAYDNAPVNPEDEEKPVFSDLDMDNGASDSPRRFTRP